MDETMILKRMIKTINENCLLEEGDVVIVGISGGPDSVCLLHSLKILSSKLKINLFAVHINHMLRGEEASGDEEYVKNICKLLDIPLYIRHINIKEIALKMKLSVEEAGREARYKEFDNVAGSIGASKIAVAHNRNDQAETILMRIIRGTGLDGLKGIEYKRGKIIRPLLDISRRDIEEYCRTNNLEPRTDSSNLEEIYTRNKIRLSLIPYVNDMFETDFSEVLCRMSAILKDDNKYIEENASIIYNHCVKKQNSNEILIDINDFNICHMAVKRRIIRRALLEVVGSLKGIESRHIEDTIEIIERGRTGSRLHLPHNLGIERSYKFVRIYSRNTENVGFDIKYDLNINIPGETKVSEAGIVIKAEILEPDSAVKEMKKLRDSSLTQFFDYEKLKMGINIRSRHDGDVFKPLRSNGTRKLKEYFIDMKIPRSERGTIPLVATGKEIVWIIGYKTSDKFVLSENTKSVLSLSCTKIL